MTKEEVIAILGKPYKVSFKENDQGVFCEEMYYKEQLWNAGYYWITSVLQMENNKLVLLKQNEEEYYRTVNDKPERK